VFGNPPGTIGHPVPGYAVGYMPQEVALYAEFTIRETLEFYSRIHGMTDEVGGTAGRGGSEHIIRSICIF
jgi:ABC-type multidrug transport system ATPase subunit